MLSLYYFKEKLLLIIMLVLDVTSRVAKNYSEAQLIQVSFTVGFPSEQHLKAIGPALTLQALQPYVDGAVECAILSRTAQIGLSSHFTPATQVCSTSRRRCFILIII